MEVDAETNDERTVKKEIRYSLGMALADRDFYNLHIMNVCHVKAKVKRNMKNKIKVRTVIVAIAKCENNYIREWVEHYRKLGVDSIIIGDNNDIDGERMYEVLSDYILDGFVTIKDYRGKKGQQQQFYTDMYREYNSSYDWFGFFDCDEFVCLRKHKSIQEFLSDHIYDPFNIIRLNWMCFGDNGLIRVKDGDYSLQSRFTTPMERDKRINRIYVNHNSKTFMRGGLGPLDIYVHGNYTESCCNDIGEEICNQWCTDTMSWEVAYIKHYNTKTIEEWMDKMKRGYPDRNWNNKAMLSVERFFMYNEKTEDKIKYITEHSNQ